MQPNFVILVLSATLLISCGPNEREQSKYGTPVRAEEIGRDNGPATGAAISHVSTLMGSAIAEDEHCRGGSGDNPETMRACNRRQELLIELEKNGWCFEDAGRRRWLRCTNDPAYQAGQYGSEPPYSDEDISEAMGEHLAPEENAAFKLYEDVKRLNASCVTVGGGVSGSPDCEASMIKEDQLESLGYCIDYPHNESLARCDEVH